MPNALEQVLGEKPPAAVAALPPGVLTRLAEQIDDARRRQVEVMAEAVRIAVNGVPFPVRGVVKKAVSG